MCKDMQDPKYDTSQRWTCASNCLVKRIRSNCLPYRSPNWLTSSVLQSVRDSEQLQQLLDKGRTLKASENEETFSQEVDNESSWVFRRYSSFHNRFTNDNPSFSGGYQNDGQCAVNSLRTIASQSTSPILQHITYTRFDNLYLDMNGIIHNCIPLHVSDWQVGTHKDDQGPSHKIPEEKMFLAIFAYIEHLYGKIKPKKLFFMAVDGSLLPLFATDK